VNVPQLQCVSYDNTATFTTNTTGTTGSAGQTVKVCPTVPGLTMGYWSNKNGQGRITSEATSGTCPTATYLLQYAPFQGGALTSTSTCAQTAAYVYNVIKGGGTTCASTTCNAMLKAQMLSTALNVHFSVTPGGEVIDLVNGCKMIDSSTLTATCSGAENWSPAFNNQAAMTVTQMLVWAASKSNVGGSAWYLVGTAQSKTLQVLAKDAFDAINNGVALSA
jgi:hypothetical protein